MFHALRAIVTGNLKLWKYLRDCRLDGAGDGREIFSYKDRIYDRERFVELVRQDFSRLELQDRLVEVKALVDGLDRSPNRELDLAYIEAYRRTLEGKIDL